MYNTFSIWFLTYNYVDTVHVFYFFCPCRSNSNICLLDTHWMEIWLYTYTSFAGLFIHFAHHFFFLTLSTLIRNGFHYAHGERFGERVGGRETEIIPVMLWINAWWWLRRGASVGSGESYRTPIVCSDILVSFRFSRMALDSIRCGNEYWILCPCVVYYSVQT